MTQSPVPRLFEELQHPASSATQLTALKALKNELVGHELRKREWINYGIIPILSRILSSRRGVSGKRATRELHGNGLREGRGALSDDDASCLQAIVILGILAHGTSRLYDKQEELICDYSGPNVRYSDPERQGSSSACVRSGVDGLPHCHRARDTEDTAHNCRQPPPKFRRRMARGQTARGLALLQRAYRMPRENHWTAFRRSSSAADSLADYFSRLQDVCGGKTQKCAGGGGRLECLGYTSGVVRCRARVRVAGR